ncbi:translation initiation factor eIF-2B [Halopenitus persicus]|uniref:Translation initiation factor eIF-2B subunit delta n=1 Tax=Halopenitus persicus TaxID=1048396 RepID=A0A1H3MB97_9EURY|nr:translation initiation factor eIF-2B [Halopenitus persicus]QHS16535.1 translation initiation factor eIF-2B [haloarchaeon 3A1-DGR]SDY73990.1 translation initiation factor eIF-2B subunit delta [Halopenitus persicus]
MIDETVAEIRAMQTHSSSVVAVKAAEALADLLDREYASLEAFERDLEHNAGVLRRSDTSHAALHNAVRDVERAVIGEAESVEGAKHLLEAAIDDAVDAVETGKRRAAEHAANLLADGDTILTHDYSSTVLEAVENATAEGTHLSAYATEARPRYLGRKSARALSANPRVDATMVVDGAMGHALRKCDRVLLGMTCITDGTYYNRIGTFPLVTTAAELGVPVTVVGSSAKIIESFRFENDFRDPVEVMREPIEDVRIENPAYDATPVEAVDQVITDEGDVPIDDLTPSS